MKKSFSILSLFSEMFGFLFTLKKNKSKYGEQYSEEVNKSIITLNTKRMVPLSIFIGIFQIIFTALDYITGFYGDIGRLKYINIGAELLLFGCCVIFGTTAFILLTRYNSKYFAMLWLNRTFYFLVSVGMIAFVFSETCLGQPSRTIYYVALIFSLIPIFSLKEAIFYITIITSAILGIIFSIGNGMFIENVHFIFILISSWFLMFYLRANTINTMYNQFHLNDLNKKYEILSMTDCLTGLPNRRGLDEYVKKMLPIWKSKKEKVMVLMADIDNFKNYNDTFSHLDGDDCLNAVSSNISRTLINLKDNRSIIARIGGEEFMIVIDCWKTKDEITDICRSIKQSVEDMHLVAGKGSMHKYVTISMGGSIYSTLNIGLIESNPIEAQYRFADYEMYNAKKCGKNLVSIEGKIIK